MSGIMREEFSRAFSARRLGLAAFLALVSFAYGSARVMEAQASSPLGPVLAWEMILARGSYGFFAALMAALPFADSLLADRRPGFINQVLTRVRFRDYLAAKSAAVFCSGLAAVAAPTLILLGVCLATLPPRPEWIPAPGWSAALPAGANVIAPAAAQPFPAGGLAALTLAMLALFGGLYALTGLAGSFVIRSPFVVLGLPFVLYSLGYFILPTSARLAWLGSTEAALLPVAGLLSPLLQYLALAALFAASLALWGRKERLIA